MAVDKPSYCSPFSEKNFGITQGTCYSLQDLQIIANEYNKLSTHHKIDINKPKHELHQELEEAFSNVCKTEFCWVDNKYISNSSLKHRMKSRFRPKKPLEWYDNKRTWLNTYDILFVMEQYQELYTNFSFIGVYPMDFASHDENGYCVGDSLCTLDIKSNLLNHGKTQFAFVMNLDYHNEPGSHWVSMYCNLDPLKKNFGIYYYDSVANDPTPEAYDFMNNIKAQVKKYMKPNIAKKFKVRYNKIQKQFKDTECGMFSIIFITQCLKYVPFNYICKHMRTDDDINKLRDVIYTPAK